LSRFSALRPIRASVKTTNGKGDRRCSKQANDEGISSYSPFLVFGVCHGDFNACRNLRPYL
jgi:hypothetical protein